MNLAELKRALEADIKRMNETITTLKEGMSPAAISRKVEELMGKSLIGATTAPMPAAQKKNRKQANEIMRYILTTTPGRGNEEKEKDWGIKRALNVATGEQGGYLVEEDFIAEVQRELPNASPVRSMSRVFSGVGLKGSIPKETGTVGFEWGDENAAPSEKEFKLGQINWSLNKLAALTFISRELIASSAIDVVALLTTMYTEQRGPFENAAFTNGDGSGKPLGWRNAQGISTVAQAGSDLVYEDLTGLVYGVPSQYRTSPKANWEMNDGNILRLANLKDADKRPILLQNNLMVGGQKNQSLTGAQVVGWVLNWPVVENPDMADDEIKFGDQRYAIFDTGTIEIETTMDGAGAFEKHQLALKYIDHVDGKPTITAGFKVLTGVSDPLA